MADETQIENRTTDVWSYRLVVTGLVTVLMSTVFGIIAMVILGKEIPSELTTIAVPVLTALAAILSPLDSLGLGTTKKAE